VVNAGAVSPDAGASGLHIQGNYRQLPGGTFNVGLGGTAPSQITKLFVSGSATLDGALATATLGGFTPLPGSSYDVLSYGSLSGHFGQCVGADPGTKLELTPLYGDASLALLIGSTTAVNDPVRSPEALRFFGQRGTRGASFVLELPYAAELKARVYDASGREVARLADGMRPAGVHVFSLDGSGGAAPGLASGVYFARAAVVSGGVSEVRTARVIVLH
jgi:hypothetical protein